MVGWSWSKKTRLGANRFLRLGFAKTSGRKGLKFVNSQTHNAPVLPFGATYPSSETTETDPASREVWTPCGAGPDRPKWPFWALRCTCLRPGGSGSWGHGYRKGQTVRFGYKSSDLTNCTSSNLTTWSLRYPCLWTFGPEPKVWLQTLDQSDQI